MPTLFYLLIGIREEDIIMKKLNEEQQAQLASKEEDILAKLMGEEFEAPKGKAKLERLGIQLELKGLTGDELSRIRKECTRKRKVKGVWEEKLDNAEYDAGVIIAATTNFNWNNTQLLAKYELSEGKQFIIKKLLAGEKNALVESILQLSGFGEDVEVTEDDIKN
nr:hypothetical protein DRB99_07480 [Clostridium butyricum]